MTTLRDYIKRREADLILIRGLPGSGKSTYAKKHFPSHLHIESDQFFMKNGKYEFDINKLKTNHKRCFLKVKKALERGKKVVVSNTFTTKKEIQSYLDLAESLEKNVKVLRMEAQYQNQHDVPEEIIKAMKSRFQNIDGEERVR